MNWLDKMLKTKKTSFIEEEIQEEVQISEQKIYNEENKTNLIIQEIHNSFENASDLALKEAQNIINNTNNISEDLRSLEFLGFTQVKGLNKAKEEQSKRDYALEQAKNILYFQQTYPQYKFITKEQIEKFCDKYGLAWASVNKYTGEVPKKNLDEIVKFKEEFTIKDNDFCYKQSYNMFNSVDSEINYDRYLSIKNRNSTRSGSHCYKLSGFDICAPIKDMQLDNLQKINGRYNNIPDPIVLFPVRQGYLIVSKWGLEGDDELVTNEKMN